MSDTGKKISAEELKNRIISEAYPIGFDYEKSSAHRKDKSNSHRSIFYYQYGLKEEDLLETIDEMSAIEESKETSITKEKYDILYDKYCRLKEICSNLLDSYVLKDAIYFEMKDLLDGYEKDGTDKFTKSQILSSLIFIMNADLERNDTIMDDNEDLWEI